MKKVSKKLKIVLLLVSVVISMIVLPSFQIKAANGTYVTKDNQVFEVVADANTAIPEHEETASGAGGFGEAAGNGRIWVDKSVTSKDDGTFQIDLSALTQEYISTVSSVITSDVAADVVFVLDGSGSMTVLDINTAAPGDPEKSVSRLEAMVDATNNAIDIIMQANPENRVSVTIYNESGNQEMLPLDSYFLKDTKSNKYLTFKKENITYVYFGDGLYKVENGQQVDVKSFVMPYGPEMTFAYANGGTKTQKGVVGSVQKAIVDIEAKTTNEIDIKERRPFVFLLSDGGATYGNLKWFDINDILTNTAYIGSGNEDTTSNDKLAQITASLILSSALMKDKMDAAYNNYNTSLKYPSTKDKIKFYSVGLGSDINGPYVNNDTKGNKKYAWIGLNPADMAKAIKGEAIDPSWVGTPEVSDKILVTKSAAEDVQASIGKLVTDARDGYEKYAVPSNYEYSYYYKYANDYSKIQEAFDKLAKDVANATEVIRQPVDEEEINGVKTSVYFKDEIGKGFEFNETAGISVTGSTTNPDDVIKGELDQASSTSNKLVYKFKDLEGSVVVDKSRSVNKNNDVVEWYITSADLEKCLKKIKADGVTYEDATKLNVSYNVKLSDASLADPSTNGQHVFYTNEFMKDPNDANNTVGGTVVTYNPSIDNNYYYFTNSLTGIVGTLDHVGYNTNGDASVSDISHFLKGNPIGKPYTPGTLNDVYITTDMVSAAKGVTGLDIKVSEIGTYKDLGITEEMLKNNEFVAALDKTMMDCEAAIDGADTSGYYAFRNGIQKAHEHTVEKSKISADNNNVTQTAPLISAEHFENGKITMTLGNNGRASRITSINKSVNSSIAIANDTLTYTISVSNHSNTELNKLKVSDTLPAELTDIKDATAAGIATFSLNNNEVTWSDIKVAANSTAELKVTAKIQAGLTSGAVKNTAKLTSMDGVTTLTNPATSNEVTTNVQAGVVIEVKKDNVDWIGTSKKFVIEDSTGTKHSDFTNIPDGTAFKVFEVIDETTNTYKDTMQTIDIANKSGKATIHYYTLSLTGGTGIVSLKANGEDVSNNQYVYLKGEIAEFEATLTGGYKFNQWKGQDTTSTPSSPLSPNNVNAAKTTVEMNQTTTMEASATLITQKVDITLKLDDSPFPEGNEKNAILAKVQLKDDTTNSIITYDNFDKVVPGNYTLQVNGVSTGIMVTVTEGTNVSETIDYYSLKINTDAGIASVNGEGNYLKGTTATISATPASDYVFEAWVGNTVDAKTNSSNSVVMNQKEEVNATSKSTIIAPTTTKIQVDVTKDDVAWQNSGKDINVHDVNGTKVDVTQVGVGDYFIYEGTTKTSIKIQVTQDDIDKQRTLNVSVPYYSLLLTYDEGFSGVSEGSNTFVFLKGSAASISATTKDANHAFVNWTGTKGNTNITLPDLTSSLVMDQKHELKANSKKVSQVNINVNLDGSQYVGFDKSSITLKNTTTGAIVTDLTQVDVGSYVVQVAGKDTYMSLTTTGVNKSVTLDYFSVVLIHDAGIGSVSGNGVYLKGDSVTIDATLKDDYQFVKWTGDTTLADKKTKNTFTINDRVVLTASSKLVTYSKVEINVTKDGSPWENTNKEITLKGKDGATISNLSKVANGSYTIYVDGASTGREIVVNDKDASAQLNYFTVTLNAGSGIQSTIGSGIYLEGTSIDINAMIKNGYTFVNWTGSFTYNKTTGMLEVRMPIQLTANAMHNKEENKKAGDKTVGTSDTTADTLPYLYVAIALSSIVGIIIAVRMKRRSKKKL